LATHSKLTATISIRGLRAVYGPISTDIIQTTIGCWSKYKVTVGSGTALITDKLL